MPRPVAGGGVNGMHGPTMIHQRCLSVQEWGNDRRPGCVINMLSNTMDTLLIYLQERIARFERWFDRRFGWFFTNGMKERPRRHGSLKA